MKHTFARLQSLFVSLPFIPYSFFWRVFEFGGQLGENHQREETLNKKGVLKEKTLLLFGDSQIEYWRLSKYFGTMPIISRGLAGECAYQARERFESDCVSLKPDMVALLIGTNDIADGRTNEDIRDDILYMIKRSQEHGIKVYVCSLLPVREDCEDERPANRMKEINTIFQDLCHQRKSVYIDFWKTLATQEGTIRNEMTYDGLHPNRAGYLTMAKEIIEVYNSSIRKE